MTEFNPLTRTPDGFQTAPEDPVMAVAGMQGVLRQLDLSEVDGKTTLMRRLALDLTLPDYFGHNWDALYDVLSDPQTMKPTAIWLRHWPEFQRHHHDLAASLESVLLDAQKELATATIPLWILV